MKGKDSRYVCSRRGGVEWELQVGREWEALGGKLQQ